MPSIGPNYYMRDKANPDKIAPLYGKAMKMRRLLLDEPARRWQFKAHPPQIDETQQMVLTSLRESGIAIIPASQLFKGQSELIAALQETNMAYLESDYVKEETKKFLSRPGANRKDYTIDWILRGERIGFDYPLVRVGISQRILDIANAYLGMLVALRRIDMVLTLPEAGSHERTASQNWHRDPEGRSLLKVFYFATDVDERSGPFEYVTHSRPGDINARVCRTTPGTYLNREEQDWINTSLSSNNIVRGVVPAQTFVFCDTFGLHRGGFTQGKMRLHSLFMYVRPSCSFFRRYDLTGKPPSDLTASQSAALFG